MEAGIGSQLPSQGQIKAASRGVEGIRFVLTQNAHLILKDQQLSNETIEQLENQVLTTSSLVKLDFQSFIARSNEYSEVGVLCAALNVLLHQKDLSTKQLNIDVAVNKEEINQLNLKYNKLQEDYNKVVKDSELLQRNSPDQLEYSRKVQELQDANDRIKLQQKSHDEEVAKLKSQLEDVKKERINLEKEIEDMQTNELQSKRSKLSDNGIISDAFGLSNCNTARQILAGIKTMYEISQSVTNVGMAIAERMAEPEQKLNELLSSFNVHSTNTNPVRAITDNVENNFRRGVLQQLQQKYGADPKITDIIRSVDDFAGKKQGIIDRIYTAFGIPQKTPEKDLVNELKEKFNERANAARTKDLMEYSKMRSQISEPPQKNSEQHQKSINVNNKSFTPEELKTHDDEIAHKAKAEAEEIMNAKDKETGRIINDLEEQISTLREQASQLSQELQQAQDEAASAKAEAKHRASQLKRKNEELNRLYDELSGKLERASRVNRSLQRSEEKARAAAGDQQSQIEALQNQLESATSDITMANEALNAAADENERLRQRLNIFETQSMVQSNLEAATAIEEDQSPSARLVKMASEATEQLETQSKELMEQSKQRMQLISLIQKQQQLINALEQEAAKPRNTTSIQPTSTLFSPLKKQQEIGEIPFLNAIDNIEGDDAFIDEINHIAHNKEMPITERLSNVFEVLLSNIEKLKKESQENKEEEEKDIDAKKTIDKLVQQNSMLLKFVEDFAHSNADIQEDMRSEILESCARINVFMQDYAPGFIEDASLLELTDVGAKAEDLQKIIDRFFKRYGEPVTNEGKQLMLAARSAIAAAAVLRRYGEEAQTHIGRINAENRNLRSQLSSIYEASQRQAEEKISEYRREAAEKEDEARAQTAKDLLESIEAILRSNITNPEIWAPISECLSRVRSGEFGYYLDAKEFNDAVADELNRQRSVLQDTNNQLTALRESVMTEAADLENTSGMLQKEATNLVETQLDDIERLARELDESRAEYERVKEEFEQLRNQNRELLEELEKAQQLAQQMKAQFDIESQKQSRRFKAKLEKGIRAVSDEYKVKIDKLQRRLTSIQTRMQGEIDSKNTELQIALAQNEEITQSQSQLELELRSNEQEAQNMITRIRVSNKELNNKVMSLELENKLLNVKLRTAEEKAQRDKEQFESSVAMRIMKNDNDLQARTEKINAESEKRHHEFLVDVCGVFKDFVDFSIPINDQNVLNFLADIYAKLRMNERDLDKCSDFERQMKDIRAILNAPKGTRTTAAVKDFVENAQRLRSKVDKIEKELKAIRQQPPAEWEEWAQRVYRATPDGCVKTADARECRKAIEEAVYASARDTSIARKLDLLRAEKAILLPAFSGKGDGRPVTLTAAIASMMFLRRIARISKHIPSELSFRRDVSDASASMERSQLGTSGSSLQVIPAKKSISDLFGRSIFRM